MLGAAIHVGAPALGAMGVVVCEADRDEGVAPTGECLLPFVGAPPSGRWVVVCEADRDEGGGPTKNIIRPDQFLEMAGFSVVGMSVALTRPCIRY